MTETRHLTDERERAREDADEREDGEAVRFDDPEWDDEFCTWLDSGLRTCCG